MITINKIVDGISEAINKEFGNDYEIYTENVEQGLNEPCFSILCLNPAMNQFLESKYFRIHKFCIHFFSELTNEQRAECFSVQERLMDCLEIITVDGDKVRGTKMNGEIFDGVLSFFVNYDMFVVKQQETLPAMETFEQVAEVKG